jgi:putative glycerol-1-phosphate prenyltransferase
MTIYSKLIEKVKEKQKSFALLIDPDKISLEQIKKTVSLASKSGVDYIFIGGSLLLNQSVEKIIKFIKDYIDVPIILFPGHPLQLADNADGLLFLSLISGRNADMLIGNHVSVAPLLKNSKVEVIPTGYMIIESGKLTSVSYISNTTPIPNDKDDIAMCTAIAGELLGLKIIFMDAGSGAYKTISSSMINRVKNNISIPLIIGGGIKTPQQAIEACNAGADIIVVGNAIENDISLIDTISQAIHSL